MLDRELLSILVCPKCKGDLRYDEQLPALECAACAVRYPVRDGIPILLIDEAQSISTGSKT